MSEVMQAEQQDEDAQAQASRAGTYRLLASLLCDVPSREVLDQLALLPKEMDQEDAMSVAFAALPASVEIFSQEQIATEYHDLFIGVGRGEMLPYASFYLTGFLMEKPLGILRDDLAALGYAREDGIKEPEDHIAFLAEVMSLMIIDQVGFEQQKEFFEAHIVPWASRFFSELIAAESAVFYSRVGELGLAFIGFEQSYFSMSA